MMSRTIQEIKTEMCEALMRDERAAELYGFAPGTSFGDRFGPASVESVLLYVFAVCAWAVEKLVAEHRAEVTADLERLVPHRARWYREKALAYMDGHALAGDTDGYDTSGMSGSEIAAARVVKHAVAVESRDAGLLTVKVAGERGGVRCPLEAGQAERLEAYLREVKDAGVRLAVVNAEPDTFDCRAVVYHDPLLDAARVREACEDAVGGYIANLPFNGEYTDMALADALRGVGGVRIAEVEGSWSRAAGAVSRTAIKTRTRPAAGYFAAGDIEIEMKAYDGDE